MDNKLRQRLLLDIAELQGKPYPNISLHVQDEDITRACLVLIAEGYGPMHLTVHFPPTYPLSPPSISMNSQIVHPNIYGTYICASILNTVDGFTPAYTLKGIAIQLLSFFSSDTIEQTGGGYSVDLHEYRKRPSSYYRCREESAYVCGQCNFGKTEVTSAGCNASSSFDAGSEAVSLDPTPQESAEIAAAMRKSKRTQMQHVAYIPDSVLEKFGKYSVSKHTPSVRLRKLIFVVDRKSVTGIQSANLPDEILLSICSNLETEELFGFAEAWDRIGQLITTFDVIRERELQCFCFKKDYKAAWLGVGVNVSVKGKTGSFSSEFDILSQDGFRKGIRRSVQGVQFGHWLPLAISRGHWNRVKKEARSSLISLSAAARLNSTLEAQVLYHFMNDIVVKLNEQASSTAALSSNHYGSDAPKSTLTHASEKAIESYFHLFHLLLCLATAQPSIVAHANGMLHAFMNGATSKAACPNLGHLLVAALVSDVEMSESVIKAIIKETITRNVVWMLDAKGANMPELAYLEPAAVSNYRLHKCFEASKTSYRLLMFLNLFQRTAVGSPRKPLNQLRDEAFDRHGAPPRGAAKGLAESIRRIHTIERFPDFLAAMGIKNIPSAATFTAYLRQSVRDSMKLGYSKMAITQGEALWLRSQKERSVQLADGVRQIRVTMAGRSFFPGTSSRDRTFDGQRGIGGRGGRGGQHGRGRGH
jgi:ubiquitin-protein ligase